MTYQLKRGLNVPAITVLDEAGRVMEDQQRALLRHISQDGRGANVIFAVGTNGEWNRIANAERLRVMEISADEIKRINASPAASAIDPQATATGAGRNPQSIELWVGVNGTTRAEILENLDAAIDLGVDAAVIAPLAVNDLAEGEIVRFFRRDVTALLEARRHELPIFLYDNADIAAPGNAPHIRTRIVKDLSRLPWLRGIKASAPRHVIGNYMKAALHYKQPGEFGVYVGNAMLIFSMYRPSRGVIGRLREGWRDYLLSHAPPLGVVSGPGNVLPREWQKAWRVCWAGDEELIDLYEALCLRFEASCQFEENGRSIVKMIACMKYALELDGVISSSLVGRGTVELTTEQKRIFAESYRALREYERGVIDPSWITPRVE